MSMDFPANPTVGQIAQLGAFNYQCVSAAPQPIVWDVIGDAEVQNIGGFNLTLEAGLAGLGLFEFDVEPGYDYELVVQGVTMSGNGERVIMDARTADGGSWVGTAMGFGETYTIGGGPDPNGTNVTTSPGYIGIGGTNATAFLDFHGRISNHDNTFGFFKFDYLFSCINGASQFVNASGLVWSTAPNEIDRVRISAETTTFAGGLLRVYRRSRQPLSFLTGKEPGGMYLYEEIQLTGLNTIGTFDLDPNYDYEWVISNADLPAGSFVVMSFRENGSDILDFGSVRTWGPSAGESYTQQLSHVAGLPISEQLTGSNALNLLKGSIDGTPTANGYVMGQYDHRGLNNNTLPGGTVTSGNGHGIWWVIDSAPPPSPDQIQFYPSGGTSFLSGTFKWYRRNRAITYP